MSRWQGMEEMVLDSTGGTVAVRFLSVTALVEASAFFLSVIVLLLCASLWVGFFADPLGFLGIIVVVHLQSRSVDLLHRTSR